MAAFSAITLHPGMEKEKGGAEFLQQSADQLKY